jgi:hypothetical protein
MTGTIITEFTNSRDRDALWRAIAASSKASPITVVDIRWNTYYPVSGEFRPAVLEPWLAEKGIKYVYYQKLGNPFKDLKDIVEMEKKYKDYAVSLPEFYKILDTIRVGTGTFCLLCYCKPPRPCHRYWLRDLIWIRVPESRREPALF